MKFCVIDIVGNEEAKVEDSDILPQKAADPVVYQLVRVDGDGRLVPATDDEVMVVEDLLQDDKIVPDTGKTLECNTNYGCGSSKVQFKGSEGLPQLGDLQIGAEKLNEPLDPEVDSEKVDGQNEEKISFLTPNIGDGSIDRSGSPDGCSKLSGGLDENGPSTSATSIGLKPDFFPLRGEIRLDNLSVKELQETFKATFGRETSVKDKQWLKRRIVMGLTNSCDFSTTTFAITDNRVVKEGKEEIDKSADHFVLVDCLVKSARKNHEIPSTCDDKKNEIHSYANGMKIQSSIILDTCESKDADLEQRPAKRVRKPTRRYIEELSEVESRDSGAKIISSIRHPVYDQPSAKVCARPGQNFGLNGGRLTRQDSLGGSGVQVPYVSRIRRSRPRENFMTLTKLQPSGMGMPIRLVKNNAVASRDQLDIGSRNNVLKAGLSPKWFQEPPVAVFERCQPYTENKTFHLEKKVELKNMDSYKDNSDDEVVTVPTANGGMRRKHHRPWTLTEVVKLVEGVAKYGAGRWSEIKRLALASYSYRTSVDLKDKWRNLLRASLADLPDENGMHSSRKQGSVLIPAPILSRVRELADIQTHVTPSLNSSKLPDTATLIEVYRKQDLGYCRVVNIGF